MKKIFRKLRKESVGVGLDVGSNAVKIVALLDKGGKGKYQLMGYSIQNVRRKGNVTSDAEISSTIREIYSEMKVDERRVRSSVSGSSVVVRYIELPKMSLEEARNSIKYEASQHIPFDVKEVEMDCYVLDKAPATESNMMKVILVAAKKAECERLIKIIREGGLIPTLIDVDSLAVVNAFGATQDSRLGPEPIALINIGAKKTDVNIIEGGVPTFTRNIEIGGEGITVAIARGLNMDLAEAERLKVFGDSIIQPHLGVVLNSVLRQLRASFDYYEGLSGKDVTKIFLSGGASLLTGFWEFIRDSLGIATVLWNPLQGIDTSKFAEDKRLETVASTLDVAVGLAIRRVNM